MKVNEAADLTDSRRLRTWSANLGEGSRLLLARRPLRFIDEENVLAVGDQLATEVRPHPARAAFDVYSFLQPGPLLGSWNHRSYECLSHLEPPFSWDDQLVKR